MYWCGSVSRSSSPTSSPAVSRIWRRRYRPAACCCTPPPSPADAAHSLFCVSRLGQPPRACPIRQTQIEALPSAPLAHLPCDQLSQHRKRTPVLVAAGRRHDVDVGGRNWAALRGCSEAADQQVVHLMASEHRQDRRTVELSHAAPSRPPAARGRRRDPPPSPRCAHPAAAATAPRL